MVSSSTAKGLRISWVAKWKLLDDLMRRLNEPGFRPCVGMADTHGGLRMAALTLAAPVMSHARKTGFFHG